MRVLDKRLTVSRRGLLGAGSASLVAMTVLPGGMIVGADGAWAAMAKAVNPEDFATLVQMARDIYPHDRLADKYYVKVIGSLDDAASKSTDDKALLKNGVAELNKAAQTAHKRDYKTVGWEAERVTILRGMESSGFFQKIRGSLITGIYNNREVWPLFGYEGPSAEEGGYISRGFDDIDWLKQV